MSIVKIAFFASKEQALELDRIYSTLKFEYYESEWFNNNIPFTYYIINQLYIGDDDCSHIDESLKKYYVGIANKYCKKIFNILDENKVTFLLCVYNDIFDEWKEDFINNELFLYTFDESIILFSPYFDFQLNIEKTENFLEDFKKNMDNLKFDEHDKIQNFFKSKTTVECKTLEEFKYLK